MNSPDPGSAPAPGASASAACSAGELQLDGAGTPEGAPHATATREGESSAPGIGLSAPAASAKPVDRVFSDASRAARPFAFDAEVAEAFDDMASRSIPLYRETHRWVVRLLRERLRGDDAVVDVGCSTGSLLRALRDAGVDAPLLGIEPSAPMRAIAARRAGLLPDVTLLETPVEDAELPACGAVVALYTLQFLPPEHRADLLRRFAAALRPGGLLVLGEKMCDPDPAVDETHRHLYEDFKAGRGYSAQEIEHKRRALDGVLRRWSESRWREALLEAGFTRIQTFSRFLHFVVLVAEIPAVAEVPTVPAEGSPPPGGAGGGA